MNANGGGIRRLTFRKSVHEDAFSPTWSPDGNWIAFSSTRAGFFNPEIYVIGVDGRGLRRLTHTRGADAEPGDDAMPHWSSDGSRILFTSNRTGDGSIWTMRADGTGERMLYGAAGTDEWYPRLSGDGRRIAFSRLFPGGREEIWVMDGDGKAARRLGPGGEPAWRPRDTTTREEMP